MSQNTAPDSVRDVVDGLLQARAVAVVRIPDETRVRPVVDALIDGGIRAIEITMTVPRAIDQIRSLARDLGDRILLGVGSVTTVDAAHHSLEAGARYVVSPVFKEPLIGVAHSHGAAALPGCFTPTEIQNAHEAGADIIKVFPADVVGMSFFRAVLAPLPHVRLMPTGGVTLDNAGDWLRAGACAVGIGGALLDRVAIEEGRYEVVTENARRLCANLDCLG
jgi:2-dehydro-3-deoxyphosphogluconate aldolase/(4S)-4-hydroxy-2-oxoglutarate aldolase